MALTPPASAGKRPAAQNPLLQPLSHVPASPAEMVNTANFARIGISPKRARPIPLPSRFAARDIRPSETRPSPRRLSRRDATLGGYRQGGQRASRSVVRRFQELRADISPSLRIGGDFSLLRHGLGSRPGGGGDAKRRRSAVIPRRRRASTPPGRCDISCSASEIIKVKSVL